MRLKNYPDAEDCFQNVFFKLFSNSPDFSDEKHLKAWLIRVAINECNNLLRKNKRLITLDEARKVSVNFEEDRHDISWALMKLPQKYSDVLYLYYSEQYKINEIAEILEIGESAVKARLKRGREKLKALYGGD
jgi:RNA polymerase sigma-70 factor (ECF subfamily)